MIVSVRLTLTSMLLVFATGGCGVSTGPSPSNEFQWSAVENPAEARDAIDAAAFAGDVNVLGQLKTPTLCYRLASSFTRSGSSLTLRVVATSTNASNCAQTASGFRYTAVFRNVASGTYTLHVIHTVPDFAEHEYSESLTID